jgi:hypothetical protein
MILTKENISTRRKTCPSATFSSINPTWTDPSAHPGLRGEKPATNRLSPGTAILVSGYKHYYNTHQMMSLPQIKPRTAIQLHIGSLKILGFCDMASYYSTRL